MPFILSKQWDDDGILSYRLQKRCTTNQGSGTKDFSAGFELGVLCVTMMNDYNVKVK